MKQCCKDYLDEQFGGDADIIKEIYEEYVRSVKEKTAEMSSSVENSDWLHLDRSAHAMKGNALAAGDAEMAETAIAIRKSAALRDQEACRAGLSKMRELEAML